MPRIAVSRKPPRTGFLMTIPEACDLLGWKIGDLFPYDCITEGSHAKVDMDRLLQQAVVEISGKEWHRLSEEDIASALSKINRDPKWKRLNFALDHDQGAIFAMKHNGLATGDLLKMAAYFPSLVPTAAKALRKSRRAALRVRVEKRRKK
ncbi:MAG TPA: hypothetical protein VMF62_12285 [Acetobacteraceae bacterium]|nr:hypothetical protein [Acetobacteraceae bacterium]